MVEIGGIPILIHIMNIYSRFGFDDFVICLGYRGYVIKEYFANYILHRSDVTFDMAGGKTTYHRSYAQPWRVTLVDTGAQTLTGGRLKRVASYLAPDEPFCLTYGDGVADIDIGRLVQFHRDHGRMATLTAVRPPVVSAPSSSLAVASAGSRKKPAGDEWRVINGGFFVLSPKVLDLIAGDQTSWEVQPLQDLAAAQELMAFHHDGFWLPMDTLRDRNHLEELWSTGRAPWKLWNAESGDGTAAQT